VISPLEALTQIEEDAMRKVIAYELLSLDGVAEQPDGFITEFDDVMRENLGRVIATQDAVLLGRRTYDDWAAFWPTAAYEPFASFINGVDKFVVTATTPGLAWANTTVVDGGLPEFVTELKQRPGRDIGVHGSIALTRSLLEGGLIDELRLVIAPAVQVHGRKLFDRGLSRRLTLSRHDVSPSGHLLLDYQLER
jgi:dihydrofolate reductase